jgi:catechol 2,3-dioxygenase-like lactoylglutathione lyase family enzyme
MIDHLSIGVKDLGAARKFYDAALAPLGYRCLSEDATSLGYGSTEPRLWVLQAERPVPANAKSGLHICFVAKKSADIDRFHAAALKAGGHDNGKPGPRKDYGPHYYAAFVTDPDGYRLEAHTEAAA